MITDLLTGYVRMQIFYTDTTNKAEIQTVVDKFKKARERFFKTSHSSLMSPVPIGTLTGSAKSMASFQDFQIVSKKLFKISEIGL